MKWLIGVVGFAFGVFALGNIIYPLLFAWPRAKKYEREGKLIKPIPLSTIISAPIIWFILLSVSIWIVSRFFNEYVIVYLIVLGITLVMTLIQIPFKNKNLEADFKETWKRYLKEES